jgi:hypothetical protein
MNNGCRKFDITVEEIKLEMEKENKLYVAYWVDLDDDCVKKSEIKILGVYTTQEQAMLVCDNYHHDGYSDDCRCYYTTYIEIQLNKDVSDDQLRI